MKLLNLITLVISFCFLTSCIDKKQKLGEEIIAKIENYKKANGHLPDNLTELGVIEKDDGPIYYTKKNDTTYIVYYGAGLGESIIYNFKTKMWERDRQ